MRKRIPIFIAALLLVGGAIIAGCSGGGTPEQGQEQEQEELVGDTCVSCHTDKDHLMAVATVIEEEPEESEGEG